MSVSLFIRFYFFNKAKTFGCPVVLLLLSLMLSSKAFSQVASAPSQLYIIKGSIIDSVSKEPLTAVTIAFQKANSGIVLKTVTTNEEGSFEITSLLNQAYNLIITNTGYTSKNVHLPSSTEPVTTLTTLLLSPQPRTLKEVKVAAKKKLVQYESDRIIYNVEDDPESAYLNTFEMLRKVPMLTIDGDDNIELNGDGGYQVLLNNRPFSLFVNNIADVFKSLPASSVKSIEVITNPPAKYESEGVRGLINIITYKKNVTGYSGSVRASYTTPGGPSTGGSLLAKAGKVGFSGIWGYNQSASPASTSSSLRQGKVNSTTMQQTGISRSKYSSLNGGGELSWQVNDLNLINAHYNQNKNVGTSTSTQDVLLTDSTGHSLQSYRNENVNHYNSSGNDIGIDYQRSFKKSSQQLLTLSYKVLNNNNTSNSESFITSKVNALVPSGRSANESQFTEQTAQIDYVQPIKKQVFELGVKTIMRVNSSSYEFEKKDTATGFYSKDPKLSNSYDNTQDIYAGYASFTLKEGKWMLRAGARIEQTKVGAQFHATNTSANQSYSNLLPNFSVSKRFGNTTNLSVSYSQRLQRPGLYYLNPYVDNRDPYNIYYGNPDLQATVTHVGNLMFNTMTKGVSFNLNFYHNYTGNSILRYTTLGKDTVARTTYGNIGNEQMDGLSLSTGFTLLKKLSLNINTSGNYQKYTSIINNKLQKNEGLSYQLSGYAGISLFKTWRTSFNATYASSKVSFQGKSAGYFTHSASLNKSFLKNKKGSLSMSVTNPFQPYRHNYTELDQEQFYMVQRYDMLMRRYTFAFNYRFGKLQAGFKRKKRGIENDDLKAPQTQSN